MLKKWRSVCAIALAFVVAISGMVGSVTLIAHATQDVANKITTEITAFGDPDPANRQGGWLWFTLSNHDYTTASVFVNETQWKQLKTSNWDSKIKFTDSEGVERTLAEYELISVYQHLWARGGQPIALQIAMDYATLKSITIEAGCQFPSQATYNETTGYTVYETQTTVTFVNDGTGNFTKVETTTYLDTTVTAFGDPDTANRQGGWLWFTLSNHDYTNATVAVNETQWKQLKTSNWDSKIKFTDSDGVEHTLAEYDLISVYQHLWARGGQPIALKFAMDYATLKSITIEAGCEFPSQATYGSAEGPYTLYRTTESVTFVNDGTGNFTKKVEDVPTQYLDTAVTAFGDPAQEFNNPEATNKLWFTLSNHDYADYNQDVLAEQYNNLNWTEKVTFTLLDGTQKKLGDYTINQVTMHKWARGGAPIAIDLGNFDYTTIQKIIIAEGCEFPSQATKDAIIGLKLYRTTESLTLVNDGTGNFVEDVPTQYLDTTVTAFGDPAQEFNNPEATNKLWFTLSNHDYADYNQDVLAEQYNNLNWTEKVTFTLLDGTQKKLGDYTINQVTMHKWARGGAPIAIDLGNFDYTTIQKIIIAEGCEFPSQATKDAIIGLKLYRTTESLTLVNDGTGNFVEDVPTQYLDTAVTAFGDPAQELDNPEATNKLWFTLSNHDYADYNQDVLAEQYNNLNWTEKITFTFKDGTQKKLGDYTINQVTMHQWARGGAPIAIDLGNFDYTTIQKITIAEGCEFPSQATKDAIIGLTIYRTTESLTLVNDGRGNFVEDVPTQYLNTNVKVFGDPAQELDNPEATNKLWFTLSNHDYADYNQDVLAEQYNNLNWTEKITFTFKDGTQKKLGDYTINQVTMHKWARGGAPIAIDLGDFDYTTIQEITIEAGCEFPSQATKDAIIGLTIYRTTESITLINNGRGRFGLPNSYIDTKVTFFGDTYPDGSDASLSQMWFVLSHHDYTEYNQNVIAEQYNNLNWAEKIIFTLQDGTQKKLGDYELNQVRTSLWARPGAPIAIEILDFDYMTIKSITIEAGCEFPSQQTREAEDDLILYRTTESVTYYNTGYGGFGTFPPFGAQADVQTSPQTGDISPISLYVLVMGIFVCPVAAIILEKKRNMR